MIILYSRGFIFLKKGLLSIENLNIIWLVLLPFLFVCAVKLLVTYSPHSICLFKLITGHECWGCGMTRAFNELFNLNFQKAYEFNPRIIIVAPLLLLGWMQTVINTLKNRKNHTISDVIDR